TVAPAVPTPLAETGRPPLRPARTRADAVVRLAPLGILLGLLSHYPGWIARRASLGQYFTGVYRSRVLARELILGIANGIDALLRVHGSGASPGFAVGWIAVTGGGFLAAWWVLRSYIRGRGPSGGWLEVFTVAVMAASAAVLTPYDLLSYALIIGT